jgi:hypothetical protein
MEAEESCGSLCGDDSERSLLKNLRALAAARALCITKPGLVDTIMKKLITRFFLLFFVIVFFCNATYARKAGLQDIVWDKIDGNLIVSFKLNNVFSSQLNEVVLNGTPITFSYFVTLYEVRDFWVDKKVVNIKIDHMMKYDILKEKFIMKRSWRIDEVLVTESLAEAQKVMTEISNVKILPFDWLENNGRYQIGIKAELSKANLPSDLRSAFFFSPSWGFETDWYILDFNH